MSPVRFLVNFYLNANTPVAEWKQLPLPGHLPSPQSPVDAGCDGVTDVTPHFFEGWQKGEASF